MLEFFIDKKLTKLSRTVPKKIIIDTDLGADDVQALFCLKTLLDYHP